MGRFVKGDLVVTPFPFSDLSSEIKRPALVIQTLKGNELILCQITSRNREDPYKFTLASEDLKQGKLKIKSYIMPMRLFTLRDSIIHYKIGSLKELKTNLIIKKICQVLQEE